MIITRVYIELLQYYFKRNNTAEEDSEHSQSVKDLDRDNRASQEKVTINQSHLHQNLQFYTNRDEQ